MGRFSYYQLVMLISNVICEHCPPNRGINLEELPAAAPAADEDVLEEPHEEPDSSFVEGECQGRAANEWIAIRGVWHGVSKGVVRLGRARAILW
jgi:hypothetical protein